MAPSELHVATCGVWDPQPTQPIINTDTLPGSFKRGTAVSVHMATSTVTELELSHWLGFLLAVLVTGGIATVIPVALYFL